MRRMSDLHFDLSLEHRRFKDGDVEDGGWVQLGATLGKDRAIAVKQERRARLHLNST